MGTPNDFGAAAVWEMLTSAEVVLASDIAPLHMDSDRFPSTTASVNAGSVCDWSLAEAVSEFPGFEESTVLALTASFSVGGFRRTRPSKACFPLAFTPLFDPGSTFLSAVVTDVLSQDVPHCNTKIGKIWQIYTAIDSVTLMKLMIWQHILCIT